MQFVGYKEGVLKARGIWQLFEYAQKGKVVFFLGAGISFGAGVPTANAILDAIYSKLQLTNVEIDLIKKSNLPFELVVEAILEIYEGDEALETFLSIFKVGKPIVTHNFVAKMIVSGRCKTVLTTNFDEHLETALNTLNVDYACELPGAARSDKTPDISLRKLHGTASVPKSVATTLTQISSRIPPAFLSEKLSQVLQEDNLLVFLGYSFSDSFDITPIIKSTKKQCKVLIIDHRQDDLCSELPVSESPYSDLFSEGYYINVNTSQLVIDLFIEFFQFTPDVSKWRTEWSSILDHYFFHCKDYYRLKAVHKIWILCGNLEKARHTSETMNQHASAKDEFGMASQRLSVLHRRQGEYSLAYKDAGKGLIEALSLCDTGGIISCFMSLGHVKNRLFLDNLNIIHSLKAEYYFQRALDYSKQINDANDQYSNTGALALIYSNRYAVTKEKINLEKARHYFLLCEKIEKENGNVQIHSKAKMTGNFAMLLLYSNDYLNALKYSKTSYDLNYALRDFPGVLQALKVKILVLKNTKDHSYITCINEYKTVLEKLDLKERQRYERILQALLTV